MQRLPRRGTSSSVFAMSLRGAQAARRARRRARMRGRARGGTRPALCAARGKARDDTDERTRPPRSCARGGNRTQRRGAHRARGDETHRGSSRASRGRVVATRRAALTTRAAARGDEAELQDMPRNEVSTGTGFYSTASRKSDISPAMAEERRYTCLPGPRRRMAVKDQPQISYASAPTRRASCRVRCPFGSAPTVADPVVYTYPLVHR